MKLLGPHYAMIGLAILAAVLSALAKVDAFSAYAAMLNTLAGLASGGATTLGVTSHSAVTPKVTP
jgi:hypothetical protein